MENKMENVIFEDVAQEIIDNEFLIEQEYDGMEAPQGFSKPITDLDYESEQP